MAQLKLVSERILMKKILSMVLALVMLTSAVMLTSCSKPEKKIEKAETAFEEESYKMVIKTTLSSPDAELDALLNDRETEIPLIYDNDMFYNDNHVSGIKMDVVENPLGTLSPTSFTVVDGILFLDPGMLKNETPVQVLFAMSDEKKLFDTFNARFVVDNTFFEGFKVEKDGKINTFNYSNLSEDGKIELKYALRRILIGIYDEYDVELTDYNYSVTLNDKKYVGESLSYTHNVLVNGKSIPVTVTTVAEYSYEDVPDIAIPSGGYERRTFEEFF